jgi:hypothetical protein
MQAVYQAANTLRDRPSGKQRSAKVVSPSEMACILGPGELTPPTSSSRSSTRFHHSNAENAAKLALLSPFPGTFDHSHTLHPVSGIGALLRDNPSTSNAFPSDDSDRNNTTTDDQGDLFATWSSSHTRIQPNPGKLNNPHVADVQTRLQMSEMERQTVSVLLEIERKHRQVCMQALCLPGIAYEYYRAMVTTGPQLVLGDRVVMKEMF